jgi:hypothetical protein
MASTALGESSGGAGHEDEENASLPVGSPVLAK